MYFGIDIFSGAGGLSLGAEMAGVKMLYAIELNQSASETYRHNHDGDTKVLCSDIRDIDPHALVNGEEVFIVMGGPPCQGFSLSNTRTRNMENPNNMLFREFVRFVRELRPKWFLFENVYGITNMNNGETIAYIQKCFEELAPDLHYKVTSKVLWASDYGVPQKRNRFFMVGNRINADFTFPEKQDTVVTVKDAISDLPTLENGDNFDALPYTLDIDNASSYAQFMRRNSNQATQNYVSRNNDLVIERYKHIKQGENWRAIPEELMQNYADKGRCHSGIYKRLINDQPSVVISNYRKSMLIHPFQHRGLSVREAARLQSFPDSFEFKGPISHMQQQIGNAVPPLLAKAVVEQIIKISESHEQR